MNSDKTTESNPTTAGPNRGWTPRWVELRPHPVQLQLWNSQARFKLVPAGRRSGKTELAKRRLVEHLFRATHHGRPGCYFAAAPTRDQAKRIFWEDFKALIDKDWIASISESELRITTTGGAQLYVNGLDVPERIEGTPWDGCVIDELANCHPGVWDEHIRPALADRLGWAWLIGVPDMHAAGQSHYAKMVQLAQSGQDTEWACFSWPSSDILPPEEIESVRRQMDPKIFEQEFLGKFVIMRGRAFADFDPLLHVGKVQYDPTLPICWSLDFNIDPMCSGILQHKDGQIRVLDELVLPDTATNAACEAFIDRALERNWNVTNLCIYGDATGNARDSTSGITDWMIVLNNLRQESPLMKVPRSNPPVKDTLNALRAKLKNADGLTSIRIDPCCKQLIEDMQNAIWPGPLDQQHSLAWLRYFVAAEYPIRIERDGIEPASVIGFSR